MFLPRSRSFTLPNMTGMLRTSTAISKRYAISTKGVTLSCPTLEARKLKPHRVYTPIAASIAFTWFLLLVMPLSFRPSFRR